MLEKNKILVIIQARMGSSRFPGKTLFLFRGKPSLQHLTDSVLEFFQRDQVIIATSADNEDQPIRDFCRRNNLKVFSGDNENVASRFRTILEAIPCDYFIRLCADSPLFDYRLIKSGLMKIEEGSPDLVTPVAQGSLPSGMNFEIVKTSLFLDHYNNFKEKNHFEHVTAYFYSNKENFILSVPENQLQNPEKFKFSFDTSEDRDRITRMFDEMEAPLYNYPLIEKCKIYERLFIK